MRPSRDQVLMDIAWLWAQRSTCSRAQVGCVISRAGRSLTNGYNGAPSGLAHCDHSCDCGRLFDEHVHNCRAEQPCSLAVHAEANALAFAARYGVSTDGAELHTTRVPCRSCAMLIINAGIKRVVWYEAHRDMTGLELLTRVGVDVWHHPG